MPTMRALMMILREAAERIPYPMPEINGLDDFSGWYEPATRIAYIHNIEAQGGGIGRQAVADFERWATAQGAVTIAGDSFISAAGFWEKLGYEIGDEDDGYLPFRKAVTMLEAFNADEIVRSITIVREAVKPPPKAWFRDSKVVNENGLPLVVYHGTKDKTFTEFDPATIKSGVGFWFTSDRNAAMAHTQSIDRKGRTVHGRVIEAYLAIKNPATTVEDYMRGVDVEGRPYDGYIRTEVGIYVAYRPNQIKIIGSS